MEHHSPIQVESETECTAQSEWQPEASIHGRQTMRLRDPTTWMWGEALELLERADRLHRQFFQLENNRDRFPTWEPPVDIFETEQELVVLVALPGVAAEQLDVSIDGATVIIRG